MIPSPSLAAAFVAGLVTFLAPCTLPLVPAYLGFLSSTVRAGRTQSHARWRMVVSAFFLMLGFSVVFVLLGSLAGLVGVAAGPLRNVLQRVGGVIIIVFGLSLLGLLRLPFLQRTVHARIPGLKKLPAGPRAFLFGVILASGWTPCIGPILGTILFLAASTTTTIQGALLLAVYSVGLAVPFLLVAFFYSRATRFIVRIAPLTRSIEVVAGLVLMFIGFLFLTGRMTAFIGSAYRALDFINYDALYTFF